MPGIKIACNLSQRLQSPAIPDARNHGPQTAGIIQNGLLLKADHPDSRMVKQVGYRPAGSEKNDLDTGICQKPGAVDGHLGLPPGNRRKIANDKHTPKWAGNI